MGQNPSSFDAQNGQGQLGHVGESLRDSQPPLGASWQRGLIARHPWLTFLLPFLVYVLAGSFEPGPPDISVILPDGTSRQAVNENWFGMRYEHYPIAYTVKIGLTIAAMIFVLPGYRQFPFRISPLAIGVGIIGVALWIALSELGLERWLVSLLGRNTTLVGLLGLSDRPAYNPLQQLAATPGWGYAFLAIRFLGLALIVPIIEEFFLRGFLMRFFVTDRWWEVPVGTVTTASIIIGTLVPVMYHPEKLASLVWFSLVTWLMVRTKNIWDCVAAHAVTNLLLGIYVLARGAWHLW